MKSFHIFTMLTIVRLISFKFTNEREKKKMIQEYYSLS